MCFIKKINQPEDLTPLIAEEDIVTRKFVIRTDIGYVSVHQKFLYTSNQVYKTNDFIKYEKNGPGTSILIYGGVFYSWPENDAIYKSLRDNALPILIGEGKISDTHVLVECIIPKGSLYYRDIDSQYDTIVSNQIILTTKTISYAKY